MSLDSIPVQVPNAPPKPNKYFCTYCYELGSLKCFGAKAEWKRHEKTFHETGEEWPCHCEEVFISEERFIAHSEKEHGYVPDTQEVRVLLPEDRVFACGFYPCRKLTYNWTERCNHVAKCMEDTAQYGGADWSYTTRFLNLLRQPQVGPTWKRVKTHWLTNLGMVTSQLQWDCKTSRLMRHSLELRTFDVNNLENFLHRVFLKGHKQPRSHYIGTQPRQQSLMATVDGDFDIPAVSDLDTTPTLCSQQFQPGSETQYDQSNPIKSRAFGSVANAIAAVHARNQDTRMHDASGTNNGEENTIQQGGAPNEEQDLLDWPEFLATTSPPAYQSTTELGSTPTPTKLSPGRNLVRRLTERRSPQFQPRQVIDNIDPALLTLVQRQT